MSQLRVISPVLQGAVFELDGDYFTIGREPDNQICLDHTSISKHHAILKIDGGDFTLFDLHSTNGVIVNGERRIVSHLHPGDKIQLGDVELRFDGERKDATQKMPPPVIEPKKETKPPPPPPKQEDSPPAKSGAEKPSALSVLWRRRAPKPEPPPAPAAPPSREQIHAGLVETLAKMGVQPPAPPPAKSEAKPATAAPRKETRQDFPIAVAEPEVKPLNLKPLPSRPAEERLLRTPVSARAVIVEPPARKLTKNALWFGMLFFGSLVAGLGYLLGFVALKFLGLVTATTGLVTLIFSLCFGGIIRPPAPPVSANDRR